MINVRNKGNSYERLITKELKTFFPEAITSRNGARFADAKGIDIINTGLFNIQCKRRQNLNMFNTLFNEMPEDSNTNIVFWKKDREKDIICMSKNDFYEILQILKAEQIL